MNFVKSRTRVRTLKMPDGTLVKIVDRTHPDANTRQIEHWDEHVDAIAAPNPIIIPIRAKRFF